MIVDENKHLVRTIEHVDPAAMAAAHAITINGEWYKMDYIEYDADMGMLNVRVLSRAYVDKQDEFDEQMLQMRMRTAEIQWPGLTEDNNLKDKEI